MVGRRSFGSCSVAVIGVGCTFDCTMSLGVFYLAMSAEAWGVTLPRYTGCPFYLQATWSRFFSVCVSQVIVQRGMLPLPWLPPGVWHRSLSCTLALHGGEHPSPIHHTASECRCLYVCCSDEAYTYSSCNLHTKEETTAVVACCWNMSESNPFACI